LGPLSPFLPQVLEFGAAGGREEDEQLGGLLSGTAPAPLRSQHPVNAGFGGGLGLDGRAERVGWGNAGSSSAARVSNCHLLPQVRCLWVMGPLRGEGWAPAWGLLGSP